MREDGAHERLCRAVGAFVDDKAEIAEGAVEHPCEGIGHADAGRVRLPQGGDQVYRKFSVRERRRQLVDHAGHVVADRDRADGGVSRTRWCRQRDRAALQIAVEHRDRRHFVPVVIFRLDPEHGHGGDAVFRRDLRGELRRRQRFVQREQWTAEESRLLAGDNRDRFRVCKARGGVARRGRRVAPLELLCEECAELCALTRMLLCVRDRCRP